LEDPIEDLLKRNEFKYDRNIKAIQESKSNHIRIDKKGVGEIDFLFLDESNSIIYVAECKHNRSRFDLFNWRRDYSIFKSTYESRLDKKVLWCRANIKHLNSHFNFKYKDDKLSIEDFIVRGIFIINAPTIYMFNGLFRAFTIHDFEKILKGEFVSKIFQFNNEEVGYEMLIHHPYFDNLERNIKLHRLARQISQLTLKESSSIVKELKRRLTNN